MKPTTALMILSALGGVAVWLAWKPSVSAQYADLEIDLEGGTFVHEGKTYDASWTEPQVWAGFARHADRSIDDRAAYISHEAIVTTGEFADPEIVDLSAVRNHSVRWQARKQPEGTLHFLHCIASSPEVLAQLEELREDTWVEIEGRAVEGNTISDKGGPVIKTHGAKHPIVLVTAARTVDPPGE